MRNEFNLLETLADLVYGKYLEIYYARLNIQNQENYYHYHMYYRIFFLAAVNVSLFWFKSALLIIVSPVVRQLQQIRLLLLSYIVSAQLHFRRNHIGRVN